MLFRSAVPSTTTSPSDLVIMRRQFEAFRQTVSTMKPELPATQVMIDRLAAKIDDQIDELDELIVKG